jgi:transcriptional regulator GlxA family with amidase domain
MDPRIAWAVAEMRRRLGDPLRVADFAAPVNLSPSRFAHLFRSETATSPLRYLQALRMDHARSLLENSTLPVRTIMGLVGCNDPSHFARDFRRRHGMSPRELRHAKQLPAARWRRVTTQPDRPHLAQDSTEPPKKSDDEP